MISAMRAIQVLYGNGALRRFARTCADPDAAQAELLRSLIRRNQDTAFGRDHGFERIRSLDDFRARVPLSTYEEHRPYIEAAMQGRPAQLTAEAPFFFATTSGTTGPIKYIPITARGHRARAELMRIWHFAANRDHPAMYARGILAVASPEIEARTAAGAPCGAESGRNYRNQPSIVARRFCLPYEVFELSSFPAKYYCIARLSAARSVSYFYTCNPSTILLICRCLADNTEQIVRDVHDGTLSGAFDVPDSFRALARARLAPDPARARALELAATAGGGRLLPRHVWPELELVSCWMGGSLGRYLDRLGPFLAEGQAVRDIGYFASEFFGSIPVADGTAAGVLGIPHNVYEFYPAELERPPTPADMLVPSSLERGRRYAIVVTTASGLYRYDINDVVEVRGFLGRTPLIQFVQKRKGVVSLTGEKLSESQVLAAVREALVARPGGYDFIAAVGDVGEDEVARYAFLIEFDDPPPDGACRDYLRAIDEGLTRGNAEYAAKRRSLRLAGPTLRVVRRGELARYRRRMVEAGKSDSVFKYLCITADASFGEEFSVEREVALVP